MAEIFCDNDVVFKLARWGSLAQLKLAYTTEGKAFGVLGSLRYVIGPKLRKSHRPEAEHSLFEFLEEAETIEPNQAESEFAASLLEIALSENADIDAGESILISVAISRRASLILTGDKRALRSLPNVSDRSPTLNKLKGHFESLEQVIARLIVKLGSDAVRTQVCQDPDTDKTAAICFACKSATVDLSSIWECLESNQRDIAVSSSGYCCDVLVR